MPQSRNYRAIAIAKETPTGKKEIIDNYDFTYSGRQAYFFRLAAPIHSNIDILSPIKTAKFVVHPPFCISEEAAKVSRWTRTTHSEKIYLTESDEGVSMNAYGSAIPGTNTRNCSGLRIDTCEGEEETLMFLDYFTRIVRQNTLPWWLTTSRNPFDLGLDFSCLTSLDDNLMPSTPDPRKNMEVPWSGLIAAQPLTMVAKILDKEAWQRCESQLSSSNAPSISATLFLDAIAKYYEHDDYLCVYHLCVCIEVLSRASMMNNNSKMMRRTQSSYGMQLVESSPLYQKEDKELLKMLFVDRGHIAHGNDAPNLRQSRDLVQAYIELTSAYYNRFLEKFSAHGHTMP